MFKTPFCEVMTNVNILHSNPDDCSKAPIKMESSQEEQQSVVQNPRFLTLRKRPKNYNITKLTKVKTVEAMSKLLCKPLQVNVTRLSMGELKLKSIPKARLKAQQDKTQKNNKAIKRKVNVNRNQVSGRKIKRVRRQVQPTSRATRSANNNLSKEKLFKNVKQPYIKLNRIEEVINKIAQTFAKVIPNKECSTSVNTDHTEEVQTKIDTKVSEPSNINTDKCLQIDNSQILTSESHVDLSKSYINESLKPNNCIQNDMDSSDSDEINTNTSMNFKRKRKIVYHFDDDSDSNNNDNDNSPKIFSNDIKMLKLSSPEDKTENHLADKEYNAIDTRHSDEMQTSETGSPQKLDVFDKSCNLSIEQNLRTVIENIEDVSSQNLNNIENVSSKSSPDNVTKRTTQQQINASTPVPLDLICAVERNISEQFKCNDSMGAEEQKLNNEDMILQIEEPLISDKSLKAKYNLLKELKVCLIELNYIKYTTDNRYSALEIEQLTREYIKMYNSSKLVNIQPLPLTDKETEAEQNDEKIDIEFMEYVPIYDSNVYEHPENTETKQKTNLDNREISSEVTDKTSEPDTFNCFKNMFTSSSFSDSLLSSSPIKTFVTEKTKQSESRLHTSVANSISKVHSPNKEQPEILHTCSPKKLSSDMRSIYSKKSVPAHNEKVLISGRKTFVTKIHAKTVNIINPKVNTKKNITSCHSTVVSPNKHKKSMEKKDSSKGIHYKCIVCDLCFENYGILQHHLTTHTQKQNNVSLNLLKEASSAPSETSENLHQEVILDSSESKESESTLREQENTEKTTPTCSAAETNKRQTKLHSSGKELQSKKKSYFSKQRTKFKNMLCKPSECSICSKPFPTATDLAAHIFLHTERELQTAFQQAKQKNSIAKEKDGAEKSKTTNIDKQSDGVQQETATKPSLPTKGIAATTTEVVVATTVGATLTTAAATPVVVTPAVVVLTTTAAAVTTGTTTTTATIPLNKLIIVDTLKAINLPATNDNSSEGSQLQSAQKSEMKKSKSFKICNCHKPEISDNCLQIEIALLCHTCKVLFRSIDCFDAHYNLSEYEICKKSRESLNRSPNLLCATCDVIFKSVQDVRHHLEKHARVNQNCTMDFRCTICKVIFVGIGPLFYYHWWKHLKEPSWNPDKNQFLNNLVTNQAGEASTTSTENYIRIADYICQKCKIPFVTESELKRHNLKCNSLGSAVSVAGKSCSNSTKKPLEIEVNCSLCNDIFTEKLTFYKHVRNKHNFISEPQFVCVSLTLIKTAYICNICMEISENIDDFEDHWLKHSTATVYFTCTYCTKAYCNGLNAFLEHARTHEVNVKQYVLSCTVNYAGVEFICKHCTIGFQTEKAFDEHNIIHKRNQILNVKDNKAQNQRTSVSNSETNVLLAESETQKTDIAQKEVNASQSTQQTNIPGPTETNRDKDKERLISILEGNEDDSEHELIIDWIEKPEEENQSEEKRDKEKQAALNNVPNAVSKNSTVITSAKNVMQAGSVSFKNLIPTPSQTNTENPKTSTSTLETPLISLDEDIFEIPQQPKCSNARNAENNNASGSTKDQEEQPAVSKNSPVKPRHGFLRVKTLAELTNRTKPPETEHPVSNQKGKQNEPSSAALQNLLASGNQATPATTSELADQQSKQTQMKTNQDKRCTSSTQSSSPAYHKNLPACNIFRTATAAPRTGQRNENTSTKVAASSSSVQNQQKPVYASTFVNNPFTSLNNTRNSNQAASSPQPTMQASNVNPAYKRQHLIIENEKRSDVSSPVTVTKSAPSNSSQHSKQYEAPSSNVNYPYSYSYSNRGNDVLQKGQQMVINPPITRDTSTIYYKNSNSSSGGMSIVINQTTPAVQNMPTINIVEQEQQQVYEPQVYTEPTLILDHPYVRQAQNVTDFSASSNVYQILTSEYQVPNRESVFTYSPSLQPPLFLCSYCSEVISFTSAEQLEIHLNVAHNFLCNVCGQRSHSFNELAIHKMKHSFI